MTAEREEFLTKLGKAEEVKITVTGRKSKRKRSTPVWFILDGRTVKIVPVRGTDTPWFRNLLKDPQIGLGVDGASVSSKAKLVRDPAGAERILDVLRVKYRSVWSESYYPKHDAYVEVPV